MADSSVQHLDDFLKYLGEKGLIPLNTAAARRSTVSKLFEVLSVDERADVLSLDLDRVVSQFANLHGKQYTPGSLQTYASRVRSSLDDFRRYVEDPVNFKAGGTNGKSNGKSALVKSPVKKTETVHDDVAPPRSMAAISVHENVFPIPIRENLVVKIYGLPFDLTEAEAKKIAGVVNAMAV